MATTKATKPLPLAAAPAVEIIGEREAARLAKHFLGLEEKRKELGRQVTLLEKEQTTIKAKVDAFVRDRSPKERVVVLAKAILRVVSDKSCRYISWKGICVEKLGAAVVAEIEANPPSKDVVRIEYNVGGIAAAEAAARKGRAA